MSANASLEKIGDAERRWLKDGHKNFGFVAEIDAAHLDEIASHMTLGRYAAGAKVCVENLGWNYPTPEGLLEGWQLSATHHRNLLEPRVARMGLAASGDYVTFFACR